MQDSKAKAIIQTVILNQFLIHFIPGLILFYQINQYLNITTGEGMLSLLIIASMSWVLGLIFESICFAKQFKKRLSDTEMSYQWSISLLLGKVGLVLIFWVAFPLIIKLLADSYVEIAHVFQDEYRYIRKYVSFEAPIASYFKYVLILTLGMFLYIRFLTQNKALQKAETKQNNKV